VRDWDESYVRATIDHFRRELLDQPAAPAV